MKKIVFSLIAVALFMACLVFAEDKYTVSGEVVYSKDADIYVCLFSQATWPSWKRELPPIPFSQIVKASPSGKASFTFKDVPKGDYLIMTFADENKNGKLDCAPLGWALEPTGYHKPPIEGHTNWYDQKFEVDKDVTGLVLNIEVL
jgi:uncharacterized protein (DUF2141 family)